MKKLCKHCKNIYDATEICCPECGAIEATEVTEEAAPVQTIPAPQPKPQPAPRQAAALTGDLMYTFQMMSKYEGAPTVGIAKATGRLEIYDNRLCFHQQLGNSMAGAIGALPMLIARSKAKADGNLWIHYSHLTKAEEGKYMGFMPMLVLTRKDGSQISFCGTFGNTTLKKVVDLINVAIG